MFSRFAMVILLSILYSSNAISSTLHNTSVYILTPIVKGGDLTALEVEIKIRSTDNETMTLKLTDECGAGTALYTYIKDLKIEGAKTVETPEPSKRLIHTEPNANLTIRYRLDVNIEKGQEISYDYNNPYPQIAPDFFYIQGPTIFAQFEGLEDVPAEFQLEEIKGWTFASDLERLDINGATMRNVANSVMLCGKDVTITTRNYPETELRVACLGQFSFSKEEFHSKAIAAINAVQQFWGESKKAYLITLVSTQAPSQFGGASFGNAIAMGVPSMLPLDEISQVILHEYFHTWNHRKLYRTMNDDDFMRLFWFSEGFTEYYTRKLALKSGLIGIDEFLISWNNVLFSYATSSVKTALNEVIVDGFWKDPEIQQLPYQRGAMFAAYLNSKLYENGSSIDQFMLALRKDVKVKGDTLQKESLASIIERINEIANRFDIDLTSDYEFYIEAGETITIPENAFGNCISVEKKMMHAFNIGYDVEKSMVSGYFSGVDPDGPAYAAGLRDGMKRIERLGGEWGNSNVPVCFRVLDHNGKEQVITYLPQGRQTAVGQQLMLTENFDEEQLAKCVGSICK